MPQEARWEVLKNNARQPDIGERVDGAMAAIERDNPQLRGVLPQVYARPSLDKAPLGELIDLVSGITLHDASTPAQDVLGRVYEYFPGHVRRRRGQARRPVLHPGPRRAPAGGHARALPRARL